MEVNLNKIKGLMREHGETQADLAKVIGKSEATVQNYLAGKTEMTCRILGDITKHYGVPFGDLIVENN